MRRITSTDLTNWAPSRDCQGHLPLLIRKLIRASKVTITKILIPVGDNVILPGYDGTLEVIERTEYIPEGLSVWEMGSGRDFKAKAERDYTTRTKNINGADAAQTSFIFVTPYVWADKDTWVKEKEEKKIWRNISVIDGLNIEDWLEQLPVVGAWLAKHLQVPFANIQPLEFFWEEWSFNLKYSIPPTLVISGRENEVESLKLFLFDTPGIISIKSFTTEETIAFCAATIENLDDDKKEEFYSRTIIVDNEQDFRLVSLSSNPIILIAKFEIGSLVNQAVRNGHHVIIPLSIDITAAQSDIDLPRIKRKGFEAGLKQMNFTDEEVENLIRNSGQSLSVLRRLLQFERNQQPDWAKNGHHLDILPALMAGIWNEFKEGDQSVISILAGKTYEQYISEVTRWKNERDPPILQIRGIWRTTSALDAWAILAPFITKSDLERFRNVFITVFSEIDPTLEVDPGIRYFASSLGKSTEFSFALKEGLCQSLILIAVFGSKFRLNATASAQSFADALVREVLFGATTDTWCSLSQFLPLLSEASPISFLESVEDSLNKKDTPIMGMFGNMHNILSSSTYHSYLLFALEGLMASSDYILRSTLILGKLTRLDPGGNTANRPGNILKAAYVAWYNQLNVEFSLKKYVLEQLVSAEPAVAWDLFISISSINNSSVSPINRCKWRFDSQLINRNVSYETLFEFNSFVFEQLIMLANGDELKTSKLIGLYPYIKPDERKKLLKFIRDSKDIYNYRQDIIWKQLKRALFHHSNHTDKEDGLPQKELIALEDICDYYLPIDLKERYKSLFDEPWIFHDAPGIKELPLEKRNELMEEKRKEVYKEIYASEGFSGILKLQEMLKDSNNLARTSAHYPLTKDEEKCILKLLNKDNTHSLNFVERYIAFKAINDTGQWISWAWQVTNELYSDKKTLTDFFLFLPQNSKYGWNLLDTVLDDDISALYWKQVQISFYALDNKDKLFAFDKLLAVNRPYIVIDAVADIVDDLTTGQLVDILTRAANIQSYEKSAKPHSSDVGTIFESLHSRSDIDADQLFNLEWQYLSYLTDRYGTHKPENILYKLTTNPDFFVDIVCYAYLPDQDKALDTYTEEEFEEYFKHSKSARNLLDIWRSIPGVNDNGIIDLNILLSWIERSRQKAMEVNRTYGVDNEIGKLLARFPQNNAAWPRDEICEVIDRINSDIILSAFRTEIFNSRGLTMRNPYDGGEQERVLATYFDQMGKRIQAKYPKTASVLFSLAQHYQIDAQREDDSAYLDELR